MMMGGGWCADYPDPQDWLSVYWNSQQEFAKVNGYKNAQADKLMNEADSTVDQAKRLQLYDQAQKLIVEDQGQLIRSNSKNVYLIKSKVKGFETTPQDSDTPGEITGLMNVTIQK
jgi:oligopeptide transport system substrate-binding protein